MTNSDTSGVPLLGPILADVFAPFVQWLLVIAVALVAAGVLIALVRSAWRRMF
jgi:hypothetical protein